MSFLCTLIEHVDIWQIKIECCMHGLVSLASCKVVDIKLHLSRDARIELIPFWIPEIHKYCKRFR